MTILLYFHRTTHIFLIVSNKKIEKKAESYKHKHNCGKMVKSLVLICLICHFMPVGLKI